MNKQIDDSLCSKCKYGLCIKQEDITTLPLKVPQEEHNVINNWGEDENGESQIVGSELIAEHVYSYCLYPQTLNPHCQAVIGLTAVKECSVFKLRT